jgi:hypothetical protein
MRATSRRGYSRAVAHSARCPTPGSAAACQQSEAAAPATNRLPRGCLPGRVRHAAPGPPVGNACWRCAHSAVRAGHYDVADGARESRSSVDVSTSRLLSRRPGPPYVDRRTVANSDHPAARRALLGPAGRLIAHMTANADVGTGPRWVPRRLTRLSWTMNCRWSGVFSAKRTGRSCQPASTRRRPAHAAASSCPPLRHLEDQPPERVVAGVSDELDTG